MKCEDPDCPKCLAFRESEQGKALIEAFAERQAERAPQGVLSKAKRPRRRRRKRKKNGR